MKRTEAQRLMDEARDDPEGLRRQTAWARWCGVPHEANELGQPRPAYEQLANYFPVQPYRSLIYMVHDSVWLEASRVVDPADQEAGNLTEQDRKILAEVLRFFQEPEKPTLIHGSLPPRRPL